MESLCGGKYWDVDLTWNTTSPDFTPCFENTALVWGTCAFLWLFAPLDIILSSNSILPITPRSPLSVVKYGITGIVVAAQLVLLYFIAFGDSQTEWYYTADFVSSLIKTASYMLYLLLLYYSRKRGIRTSGVQFAFWLISTITEAIRFRTSLIAAFGGDQRLQTVDLIVEIISFPCVCGLLVLNCWADVTPAGQRAYKAPNNPSPERNASFLSQVLYEWLTPLIWKGYKSPLEYKDLWDLNEEDKSESLVHVFERHWNTQVQKAKAERLKSTRTIKKDGYTGLQAVAGQKEVSPSAHIIPALLGAFGGTFTFGVLLKFIPDVMSFISPQILDLLIAYTEGNEPLWKGIFYAAILFLSAVTSSIVLAKHNYVVFQTGLRVRTVLVSAVYRKALRLSNAAKKKSTQGEIVNLMSVDVQKIMDLIPPINMLISGPFQIAIAMYFLWGILGPSSMAGLVIMVLMIPANAYIVSKSRKYQIVQMKLKDKRIKMMNEILSGIKVLKLYAWEKSFEEQVMKIRRQEIDTLKKAAYLSCITGMMWNSSSFLVALATFGTYVLIDEANVLDAQKAFVSLSLFNILSMPMNILPMIITSVIQAMVSIKRLNKYMNAEEIDQECVTHNLNEDSPITIDDGYFAWESNAEIPSTLRNINLRIEDGSLVAIVGPVGSGKSSLLSAVLGEIDKLSGRVNTKGSFAYVAQQAWIQNATLKDNILFGKPLDPTKYDRIVESCELLPDLEILPAGDKTEIGEKGINLSGGQKQRVSLARAAYNNADVYLLDDPLSAVDSHVGKNIFENVLGPKGLLRKKTRVLVTQGIAYLPQMDNIIVMRDGEISEIGTYRELLNRNGVFAEFLKQYVSEKGLEEGLEDTDIIKDLEGIVEQLPEETRKRILSQSEASDSDQDPGIRHRRISRKVSTDKPLPPVNEDNKPRPPIAAPNTLIQAEKSETASVSMTVYKDYLRAAGWKLSLITIGLYFLVQGLSAGSNVWLSDWSNQPPAPGGIQDIPTRNLYLGIYGLFGLCQVAAFGVATILLVIGTLRSSSILHFKMLRRILHAPMHFFDSTPIGRIVNRFGKDVDICDTLLPFNVRVWTIALSSVLATLVVISYSTPIFMVVILPIGLLYYFVQRIFVCSSRQLRRLESVTRSPIYSHFGETLAGCSTIRAFGEQERFIAESEAKVDYNQISYFPSIVAPRWLSVRLETIGNSVIFFAALFAVLGRDTLSSGLVGLSVSYALRITGGLFILVRWTSDVETNIVAVERLKEYGEIEQEADWSTAGKKPPKSWPSRGQILFNQYKTRYRTGLELVLKNLTCNIDPGEKVGIVGRTGAGKSSLTLALFRIIEPVHGSITIDGQDISRLGLHDLRGRITIIPQDPVLFSGTLRINLDPFEEHSDDTLWGALELAHLKTFAKTLPAGLQHEITEGGDNLSVGQRQLVCLARALLRKTKILVLDEATAAVDLETDDLIQQTIRSEFKESTVITIAHRLNTIMDSNRVMVLDKGEIKELDSPQNLLNNENSLFYSMAKDAGLAPE